MSETKRPPGRPREEGAHRRTFTIRVSEQWEQNVQEAAELDDEYARTWVRDVVERAAIRRIQRG